MVDRVSALQRSEIMRAVRGKNTAPEIAVRRMLHAAGYRYRVHAKQLPGRPDLIFPGRRKVIFVHGCFWHAHPSCPRSKLPVTRAEYWREKIGRNRERDITVCGQLHRLGWLTHTVWECELKDRQTVQQRLIRFLGENRATRSSKLE
jgi:DNA mismatch endonuclease, patch repair protein